MNKYLPGIILSISIAAVASLFYYLGLNRGNLFPTQSSPPTAAISSSSAPFTPPPTMDEQDKSPSESTHDLIVAAIETKSYSDLLPYLANTVQVRLESSGCCGPLTPAETVSQLSYLDSAVLPWTFDPDHAIIAQLATNSEFYADPYVVGISSNKMGFSYHLNSEGKVDAINLMASYDLLLP